MDAPLQKAKVLDFPYAARGKRVRTPNGARSLRRYAARLWGMYEKVIDLLTRNSETRDRLEGWKRYQSTARTLTEEAAAMYANGIESLLKEAVTVRRVVIDRMPVFRCHLGDSADESSAECFHTLWSVSTIEERAAVKKAFGVADVAIEDAFVEGLRRLEAFGVFERSTTLTFRPEGRPEARRLVSAKRRHRNYQSRLTSVCSRDSRPMRTYE